MKKLFYALSLFIFAVSCSPKIAPVSVTMPGAAATTYSHPAWSHSTNVYEVNVRQFSKEGTFAAFEKSLPRLKEMGVEILWFMPITPIGIEGRKENESQLGSYYAVRNYKEVNPEFGTMQDFKNLVARAHEMGFKVITDWVANHTAPDNPWMMRHPDFYQHDSTGNVVIPFDWTDTRQLDYTNREMRDSMIAAMEFWVRETKIDGFRCDVAHHVPNDFWKDCIAALKKIKDVFMLAEGEDPQLHYAGFDATYTWSMMHTMEGYYKQKFNLDYFDSVLNHNISVYPKNAYRLYFTSNHDENSWNGTEFEKYGEAYKAFAVFTQTIYHSIPLIYNGQEEPNKKRLKFFVKDSIRWGKFEMAPFYSELFHLRKRNKALDADASYQRIATANDEAIFAYTRQKGKDKVLVILNLSPQPQHFTIKEPSVYGKPTNTFSGASVKLFENYVYEMQPWDFLVLEY